MELSESTTFGDLLCARRGIAALMTGIGLPPATWLGRTVLEGTAAAGVDASEILDRVAVMQPRAGSPGRPGDTARQNARSLEHSLGAALPETLALAAKVAAVHGPKDASLQTLQQVVEELSEASVEHLEGDDAHAESRRAQLDSLLGRARSLTDGYRTPAWACRTMTRYYEALANLDEAIADQLALEALAEDARG